MSSSQDLIKEQGQHRKWYNHLNKVKKDLFKCNVCKASADYCTSNGKLFCQECCSGKKQTFLLDQIIASNEKLNSVIAGPKFRQQAIAKINQVIDLFIARINQFRSKRISDLAKLQRKVEDRCIQIYKDQYLGIYCFVSKGNYEKGIQKFIQSHKMMTQTVAQQKMINSKIASTELHLNNKLKQIYESTKSRLQNQLKNKKNIIEEIIQALKDNDTLGVYSKKQIMDPLFAGRSSLSQLQDWQQLLPQLRLKHKKYLQQIYEKVDYSQRAILSQQSKILAARWQEENENAQIQKYLRWDRYNRQKLHAQRIGKAGQLLYPFITQCCFAAESKHEFQLEMYRMNINKQFKQKIMQKAHTLMARQSKHAKQHVQQPDQCPSPAKKQARIIKKDGFSL